MKFAKDQNVYAIFLSEAFSRIMPVFPYALRQVTGYSDYNVPLRWPARMYTQGCLNIHVPPLDSRSRAIRGRRTVIAEYAQK
jgi:hypothetical protein